MEARAILLAIQILFNLYGNSNHEQPISWFLLTERTKEKVVFVGEFKGIDGVIICDDRNYNHCGFKNKQHIILKGQTQVLIELNPYPFRTPDKFYVHFLHKQKPLDQRPFEMRMGFTYDKIINLTN